MIVVSLANQKLNFDDSVTTQYFLSAITFDQMSPELMFLAGAVYVGLRFILYTIQFANIMLEAPVQVIGALG